MKNLPHDNKTHQFFLRNYIKPSKFRLELKAVQNFLEHTDKKDFYGINA